MQERETVVQAPGEEVDLVQEANAGSNVDSSSAHEHVSCQHSVSSKSIINLYIHVCFCANFTF